MSSLNITTDQIPNTRVPGFYGQENTNNALPGLTPLTDTLCLLAQRLSGGTVAEKVPTKVFSDADAALYFGIGSIAHLAARAALLSNPYINLTICGIDDANGSAPAVGSLAITGPAVTAGQFDLWIGDQHVSIGVSAAETALDIAGALQTALNSIQQLLPLTSSPSSATLDFTARNAGNLGNQIPISVKTNSGTTFTITPMQSGSGDPDVGDYSTVGTVLAAVVGGAYTVYISTLPDASNLGKIKTMITYASNPVEQMGCIAVLGYTDMVGNYAACETLGGTTLNNGRMSLAYIDYTSDNLAKTEPWKIGAAYAAQLASTPDPAIPYDGLVLASVAAPSVVDRFVFTVKDDLLHNGVAPLAVVPGEQVGIVRAISTYTINSQSVPDPTLLDINTMRTLDYVRTQVRTRLTNVFQRSKLNARTMRLMRSEVLDVLTILQSAEIVQNVQKYAAGVLVEQDLTDVTRVDVQIPTNIVSGLHVIGAVFNLILGV